MQKLTRADLWSLDEYAGRRAALRERVLAHKRARTVRLGPHLRLLFEDAILVQYQVQELLRIDGTTDGPGIEAELAAHNPLIPDGTNWKATCMLDYDEDAAGRAALARLAGIETRIWVRLGGRDQIYAIADEDMDPTAPDQASAVHFLRFELTAPQIALAKQDGELMFGVDHPQYRHEAVLSPEARRALVVDLA